MTDANSTTLPVPLLSDEETTGHVVNEGDYQKLWEQSEAENQRLKLVLQAGRLNTTSNGEATGPVKPKVTADRVRGLLGELEYNKLSRKERLTAIGCDPSVSDEFIRKVFGRGFDASLSRDLHRNDPGRYALLREAAKILDLFAK